MVWVRVIRFYRALRKRRVHVWAAYYFIGVWNLLEPMITFVGFTEETIELIKNLGVAFFPLVIILAWFHGEPGSQKFSLKEGVALLVGVVLAGTIYYDLSQTPPPDYTIVTPNSDEENLWLHDTALKKFEDDFNIRFKLQTIEDDYQQDIVDALRQPADSSRLLLAKVPLHLTWDLLSSEPKRLIPYDDIFDGRSTDKRGELAALIGQLDSYGVSLGKKQKLNPKQYFLPAEYEVMVLVYHKAMVEEGVRNWVHRRTQIESAYREVTGYSLPSDYDLESDPNLWDSLDIFVVGRYWASQNYSGVQAPRIAVPSARDMDLFATLLNKALNQGATLDQVFNLPDRKGVPTNTVVDVFCWEVIYRLANLYYSEMWAGDGLSELEIIELLNAGKIFMALVSNRSLRELAKATYDFEVATFPAGASLSGIRRLKRGFSSVWYWAVPKNSPSHELSYRLVAWLTNKENQLKAAEKYLAIPTRKELLRDNTLETQQTRIWQTLVNQTDINETGNVHTSPYKDSTKTDVVILQHFFHKKWSEIVKQHTRTRIDRDYIIGMLMI